MKHRKYEIIGAPFDIGSHEPGCCDAVDMLRKGGLEQHLRWLAKHGINAVDSGDVAINGRTDGEYCSDLAERIGDVYRKIHFPIVLGGSHAIAIGSVSAAAAYLRKKNGPSSRLGLIWVDAHADLETPETIGCGNLHGMTASHLLGFGDEELARLCGFAPKVALHDIVFIGLRDASFAERSLIRENNLNAFTMSDIVRYGIINICNQALRWMTNNTDGFVLSFDMDVIDPAEMPGVQAPEPGGLLYREAKVLLELAAVSQKLLGIDISEYNPRLDKNDQTLNGVIGLISAAMGYKVV